MANFFTRGRVTLLIEDPEYVKGRQKYFVALKEGSSVTRCCKKVAQMFSKVAQKASTSIYSYVIFS